MYKKLNMWDVCTKTLFITISPKSSYFHRAKAETGK